MPMALARDCYAKHYPNADPELDEVSALPPGNDANTDEHAQPGGKRPPIMIDRLAKAVVSGVHAAIGRIGGCLGDRDAASAIGDRAVVATTATTATAAAVTAGPLTASRRHGPRDLPTLLIAGVRAGVGAAIVMDLPMAAQSEGFTPARIAASVLRGTDPSEVPRRDAHLAHHGAGALAGVLFALAYAFLDAGLESDSAINGLSVPAYLLAVAFVVAFIYAFFAHVVLIRFGADARERASAVRRAWLVSAVVYGLAFAALVPRELEAGY